MADNIRLLPSGKYQVRMQKGGKTQSGKLLYNNAIKPLLVIYNYF